LTAIDYRLRQVCRRHLRLAGRMDQPLVRPDFRRGRGGCEANGRSNGRAPRALGEERRDG
jgi:hypothetical protein